MFESIRKLFPRGAANPGVAVDFDGAVLGANCILVERIGAGYRSIERGLAASVQNVVLHDHLDPDWLFRQCGRIAEALNRREVALAQIYGLHIPISEPDDRLVRQLVRAAALTKSGFDPDEPRVPKGDPRGGQWTGEGSGSGSAGGADAGPDDGGGGSGSSSSPDLPDPEAGGAEGLATAAQCQSPRLTPRIRYLK